MAVNFDGFKDMVAAPGGVQECNPVPFSDSQPGIVLSAGHHWLTPARRSPAYLHRAALEQTR